MKRLLFLLILLLMPFYLDAINVRDIYNSPSYYNALFRDFPVGIAFVSLDGQFLAANAVLCNFLGRTETELRRIKWQDITSREDLEADKASVKRVVEGKDTSYSMFKQYIHKRGESLWARLTVLGVYNNDGTLNHFISIIEPLSGASVVNADVVTRLEKIQEEIVNLKTDKSSNGFSGFIIENWQILITWISVIIISVGGVIFKVFNMQEKIKRLERKDG